MKNSITEDETKWIAVQRTVVSMVKESRISEAIGELNLFISGGSKSEHKSDALGYRADLKQNAGDLEGARLDLLDAIKLLEPSYMKYVHELRLGDVEQRLGKSEDAINSYRSALSTCLQSYDTSGGNALKAFLDLVPEATLSASDKALCTEVVDHSMKVLRLKRQMGISDLASAMEMIRNAESELR